MSRLTRRFCEIPSREESQRCAEDLAHRLVQDVRDPQDSEQVVRWFGWNYAERPFEGGSTLRAVLIPMLPKFDYPFTIDINSDRAASQAQIMEIVGHEIGHAHFYNTDHRPPRRIVPNPGRPEEEFCDQFSAQLIGAIATARAVM